MKSNHQQQQQQQPQRRRQRTTPPSRRLLQNDDVHIGIVGGGLAGLSAALAILRSAISSTTAANSTSASSGSNQHHRSQHRVVKITIYERRCNPNSLSSSLPSATTNNSTTTSDSNHNNSSNAKDQDKGYGMTLTYDPEGPLAKLDILEEVAKRDCPSRCHYLFNADGEVRGYFGNAFYDNGWMHDHNDTSYRGGGGRSFGGQRGNMRIPRSELRNILLDKLMSESEATKSKNRKRNNEASATTTTTTTTTATTTSIPTTSGDYCNSNDDPESDANFVAVDVEILWSKRLLSYVDRPMMEKLEKIHVEKRGHGDDGSGNNEKKKLEKLKNEYGNDEHHSPTVVDYDNHTTKHAVPLHELTQVSKEKQHQQHQQEQQPQRPVSLLFDDEKSSSSSSRFAEEQLDDATLPRNLGIFIILGISDHFHHLIDERGFYTLDGMHRLFIMPFQGSRLDDDYDIDDSENEKYDDVVNAATTSMTNNETELIQTSHYPCRLRNSRLRKRRKTMWQLSFPVSERSEAFRLSQLSQKEMQLEVLRRCGHWHTPVPDLIKETPLESIWGTSLLDRDPQSFINHRKNLEIHGRLPSRVVVLGDAAHSMSPFKGQGANQALADGPLLANWLSKAQVDSAVRGFMSEMSRRSGVKVRASREAAQELHSNDCWKWMVKQDKPSAGNEEENAADVVEATFHGVQTQLVPTLLRLLKEKKVGATLEGSSLDAPIWDIIRELNCADIQLKDSLTSRELSHLQSSALVSASNGDLRMLRQLSRQSPRVILYALNSESERSCLHLAAMQGHVDVCRWLLSEVNMDCSTLDADAKSAIELAIDAGHDELAHLLRRWASQLEEHSDVKRCITPGTILAESLTSTIQGVDHRDEEKSNCGASCDVGLHDAYRHVEQQLRGIRTSEQLRSLLRKNRDTLNHSRDKFHVVTHVLGCHLDVDDVKRDALCINELAAQGAVLLRKFIPREVDQLSLAALALRPLNLKLSNALGLLGAADIGSNNIISGPALEKRRMYKLGEGVKSSMSITADANIIVQTNFWPQMQNHSPDESRRKKQKMDSFPLHRLRYINLGEYNYNWSSRIYEKIQGAAALPDSLVSLAQRAYAIARKRTKEVRSVPVVFDMAICNIYHIQRSSDRLGGHKDNVESDLSLPLVTVSLGAPGIFLLGGMSREDVPTVILLQAGDCMVMSGSSRQYFHGVPTILSSELDDHGFDASAETYCVFPELSENGTLNANVVGNDRSIPSLDELRFAKAFLSTVRMNISTRQVV
ncbi:hypothetical protein ACHAWU_004808 [Discostella pseudostelligera]|uniref:Fe2OG dioxygenase domain-containing protein n=1 Tax=Discostella pseudostelligera TaxID=259834 RepID=A0ABD3M2F1_9STRA